MSSGNDAYIRRAFAARSDYRNFGFRDSGATPPTVRRAWAQLGDRFTVVLGGTEAYSQFFSYTLTHYLGTQLLLNAGWCNATFAQFAVATSTECKAAWESNGSYPLLLVGHSLGGAIAPILLWQLRQRVAIAYDRIVMLGAPRAFTQSMAEKAATAQYLPFVTEADPVQYLPPPRSIVQAFGALFFAGGYPGGDYFSLPPRMQINGASGLDELPNPGISEVEWTARFANFLATNADLSPHFARTYVNQAKAYHTGGRGNVASPLDWANFDALYTLDEDLARIGL
jgi:pimeloyl-ACP methyl ester carboxylesterase